MKADDTPLLHASPLSAPLEWITRKSLAAPGKVVIGAVVIALISVVATASGLAMKTSRLDLLSPRSEYNQRWLAYLEEFGDRDDAIVVIRSPQPAKMGAAIDDLAVRLHAEEKLFESIFYRRDLTRVRSKALHFSTLEDLQLLSCQASDAARLFPTADRPLDPAAVLAQLNNRLETLDVSTPQVRAQIEAQYQQTFEMVLGAVSQQTAMPVAPAGMMQELQSRLSQLDASYLTTDEGKMAFILLKLNISGSEFARGSAAIGRLREIIVETRKAHPDTWIGLTGMPVIEFDEMQASQTDMVWTSLLSLVAVALLFIAGYGGVRHALIAVAVLLLGMAYAFGFVTLVVGHLNILSAAFGVILVGLGIDFGIHYVANYLRLRKRGHSIDSALLRTAIDVGPSVVTGGVTTAAGFFCAALTDFTGVRELGIVAGGGILLCVVAAVVVLPPLIKLIDKQWPPREVPEILPAADWVRGFSDAPKLTLVFFVVLTLVLSLGLFDLRYDHNLLNLQPRHVESVQIERELFTQQEDSVWFALSVCENRQQLRDRKAAFDKLGVVAKTEEIVSLLPPSSLEKEQLVATIHKQLARLPNQIPAPAPLRRDELLAQVRRATQLLAESTPYETQAILLANATTQALTQLPAAMSEERWQRSQSTIIATAIRSLKPLAEISNPEPPTLDDLPPELTKRFVGVTHKHLLKVYAKGDIWDMDKLALFVGEAEKIDPQITGHPVQTFYASQHMQSSYISAGLYAVFAVLILLVIDFRSFRSSLLAMVPLGIGFLQMCGLIGWLGIPLNPANMIVLPLLLGIGVDDGVHLVHELRRSRGRFRLSNSTAVAVALTSTTTMASFGSMILARHRGLQTLGQVLTLGVICCLGLSLLGFPALLSWLTRNREDVDDEPIPEPDLTAEADSQQEDSFTTTMQYLSVTPAASLATLPLDAPTNTQPIRQLREPDFEPQYREPTTPQPTEAAQTNSVLSEDQPAAEPPNASHPIANQPIVVEPPAEPIRLPTKPQLIRPQLIKPQPIVHEEFADDEAMPGPAELPLEEPLPEEIASLLDSISRRSSSAEESVAEAARRTIPYRRTLPTRADTPENDETPGTT